MQAGHTTLQGFDIDFVYQWGASGVALIRVHADGPQRAFKPAHLSEPQWAAISDEIGAPLSRSNASDLAAAREPDPADDAASDFDLIDTGEAAEIILRGADTVRHYIYGGVLPSYKPAGNRQHHLIRRADAERLSRHLAGGGSPSDFAAVQRAA